MAKFNLELCKQGKAIQTKDGRKARFMTISRDRIVAFIYNKFTEPEQHFFNMDGRKYKGTDNPMDLVMVG